MKVVIALLAIVFFASVVHADSATYSYVGNPLDNQGSWTAPEPLCTCNITGELTFAQPLNFPGPNIETVTGIPSSYSFSVDGYVLNQNNSTIEQFNLGELWWNLDIQGNNGLTIFTACQDGCGDDGGATDWAGFPGPFAQNGIGVAIGTPGKWTETVPEPATHFLLLGGIVVLVALKWYRTAHGQSS